MIIEIVIPCLPPSLNSAFMYLRKGRVLTKKYLIFKGIVQDIVGKTKMPWEHCSVEIELRAPDKRKRDVDNYSKVLFDSLTSSGIWDDDSQVKEMKVKFVEPGNKNTAYTIIKIKEKEEEYDRPRNFGKKTTGGIYCL